MKRNKNKEEISKNKIDELTKETEDGQELFKETPILPSHSDLLTPESPPTYFMQNATLQLLIFLTRGFTKQCKVKDIIKKTEWDKTLIDLEEHVLLKYISPFSNEIEEKGFHSEDFDFYNYEKVKDNTIVANSVDITDFEELFPEFKYTSLKRGCDPKRIVIDEILRQYIMDFISGSLISNACDNYYSYIKTVSIIDEIFEKAFNDYGEIVNINSKILNEDFLKDKFDIDVDKIRLFEFILILEELGYLKIEAVNVMNDGIFNTRVKFLTSPKTIKEKETYLKYKSLMVNEKSGNIIYGKRHYKCEEINNEPFRLLCYLMKNHEIDIPYRTARQAITGAKNDTGLALWIKNNLGSIREILCIRGDNHTLKVEGTHKHIRLYSV